MIALIQRVSCASVTVDGEETGRIGKGLLALICAERDDTEQDVIRLLDRLLTYRVFADENGKMNHSITAIGGELLIVPQFTLAADTRSGTRPSFSPAASAETGRKLFDFFVDNAKKKLGTVQTGRFGAHMQVSLVNDGPVTFWLDTRAKKPPSP